MPRVFEIRRPDELENYRLAWNSLWRLTRRASFTQTLDYLAAFVAHQADVELRALFVADDNDELLGIVPLVIRSESGPSGTARVLTYPLTAGLGHCGPVTNQATATLSAAMGYVARTPRNWDAIELRGIDARRVDHGRTIYALNHADLEPDALDWQRRAVVELGCRANGQTWRGYWEARDKRFRGRIEHLAERLTAKHDVEHVRYRPAGAMYGDDDPALELYDDCLAIARRSWQGTSGDGLTLSTLAQAETFFALHGAAARCGTLDLNLLKIDGRPAAFVYNYLGGDGLTTVATGYDPQFAQHGVGTLLMRAMLRDSFDRGDRTVDLGNAAHEWKLHWATEFETAEQIVYRPRRSLGSQLRSWGQALRRRLLETPAL